MFGVGGGAGAGEGGGDHAADGGFGVHRAFFLDEVFGGLVLGEVDLGFGDGEDGVVSQVGVVDLGGTFEELPSSRTVASIV